MQIYKYFQNPKSEIFRSYIGVISELPVKILCHPENIPVKILCHPEKKISEPYRTQTRARTEPHASEAARKSRRAARQRRERGEPPNERPQTNASAAERGVSRNKTEKTLKTIAALAAYEGERGGALGGWAQTKRSGSEDGQAAARTDRPQRRKERGRTGRSKDGQAAATRKTQGAPPSEPAETPTRRTVGSGRENHHNTLWWFSLFTSVNTLHFTSVNYLITNVKSHFTFVILSPDCPSEESAARADRRCWRSQHGQSERSEGRRG